MANQEDLAAETILRQETELTERQRATKHKWVILVEGSKPLPLEEPTSLCGMLEMIDASVVLTSGWTAGYFDESTRTVYVRDHGSRKLQAQLLEHITSLAPTKKSAG
jgi:hypothetical protein